MNNLSAMQKLTEVLQVFKVYYWRSDSKKNKTPSALFLSSKQKGIKNSGNTAQGMIKFQKDFTQNMLPKMFQKLFTW